MTSDGSGKEISSPGTNEISESMKENEARVSQQESSNYEIHIQTSSTSAACTKMDEVKSAREMLAQNAQDIIEELNNKRTQDTQMVADFRAGLELHVRFLFFYKVY